MSHTLKILVPAVPPLNVEAYEFANTLAAACKDMPPSPRLVQFHAALTERYPCWSSGAYAGMVRSAKCPWKETPLIDCFRGDIGIVGLTGVNPDVFPFVLRRAGAFALTVIDEAENKVYRPASFSVAFVGVQKHVNIEAMVAKLMPLLKASRDDVLTAISTPNTLLKSRLDYVTAKRFAATMDLIGCDCLIEKEIMITEAAPAEAAVIQVAAEVPPRPMARLEIDAPDGKGVSWSPSWIARVFGRGSPSRP